MSGHFRRPAARRSEDDPAGPAEVVHGGALDAAVARYGGRRPDRIDLSTGINPVPQPVPELPRACWSELPDEGDEARLLGAAALEASGRVRPRGRAGGFGADRGAAATRRSGRRRHRRPGLRRVPVRVPKRGLVGLRRRVRVIVHPNNPDGRHACRRDVLAAHRDLTDIDESFCGTVPEASLAPLAGRPGFIILKGVGKFWGLAGLRLGFAAWERVARAIGGIG